MNQKKLGIVISYVNLVVGMIVNLFLTPYLISNLGDVDYSIYKVMQSFAGPLAMFHLGISTIVTRSIVKYHSSDSYTEKEKNNTLATSIIASSILAVIVVLAGIVMYTLIPSIYGNTFTNENLYLARKLFVLFVAATVMHIMTDVFSGCMTGHEKFAVSSSIQLAKNFFRVGLICLLLRLGFGVIGVVAVDCVIALVILLFSMWYSMSILREVPKLTFFDKKQIIEILSFGLAILLQAIVNQVNNNLDTMILGAYISDKQIITMYSSALSIYAVYNSLISVITHFFLPNATRLVEKNATGKELTDFVIRPGRFQATIAVACILGFALFGKNFIYIWIGEKYIDAYYVILGLMIPVTIPLVENAAIAILDVTMKRIVRSVVLVIMSVLNVIISIVLIRKISFWGAMIGTAISLLVGHGFLMNMYYKKEFKLEIGRMFYSIFKGILPAGLIASIPCVPISHFMPNTFTGFVFKCMFFVVIYAIVLWAVGLNKIEKRTLLEMIRKIKPSNMKNKKNQKE